MNFAQIKKYIREKGGKHLYNYEDAQGFFALRFSMSREATVELLSAFFDKTNSFKAEEVFRISTRQEGKITCFHEYVKQIYGDSVALKCVNYSFIPNVRDEYNADWE